MNLHKQCSILGMLATISTMTGFLVSSCAPGLAATAEQSKGLVLSVNFDKDVYALGEPVIARLAITNTGNEPVTDRWFSYTQGFYLNLEDMKRKTVLMQQVFSEQEQNITDWVYTLAPGQTVTTVFDLTRGDIIGTSEYFPKLAKDVISGKQKVSGYVVEPGTYRLVVFHDLRMNKAEDGSRNRLTASREFTVRAPNYAENQALSLFEAQPLFAKPDADESKREAANQSQINAIAAYEQIWNGYRATALAPYALYYAARILQQRGDVNTAIARYSLLMQEYPQFPLTADMLYYQAVALHDAGRLQQARQLATTLLAQYDNHLVSPDVPMSERKKGSRIRLLAAELGVE